MDSKMMLWLTSRGLCVFAAVAIFHAKALTETNYAVRSTSTLGDIGRELLIGNSASALNPIYIARGYDSVLGEQKSAACVALKPGSVPLGPPSSGAQTLNRIRKITSSEEYSSSSQVTASAAFSWAGGSADASTNYLFSTQVSSYRSMTFQEVEIIYPEQSYPENQFEINQYGKDILALPGGDALFRIVCGDRFITGIHYGGLFSAVISADAKTTAEQQSLDSLISASVSSGSVSSGLKQAFDRLSTQSSLKIDVVRNGLEEPLPPANFDALSGYMRDFPRKIAESPTKPIIKIVSADYLPLLLLNTSTNTLTTPPWVKLIETQFDYLKKIINFKNDLVYVSTHKEQFVAFDGRIVLEKINQLDQEIISTTRWARECIRSRGEDCIDSSSKNLIISKISPTRAGDWIEPEPSSSAYQNIGQTLPNYPMILELTGKWNFGSKPHQLNHPITASTEVRFTNNSSGQSVIFAPLLRMPVAPNTSVAFRFIDGPTWYVDNSKSIDVGKLRIGGDVESFVNSSSSVQRLSTMTQAIIGN